MSFEHDFGMDTYPKVTRNIFGGFHEEMDMFPMSNEIEDYGCKDPREYRLN